MVRTRRGPGRSPGRWSGLPGTVAARSFQAARRAVRAAASASTSSTLQARHGLAGRSVARHLDSPARVLRDGAQPVGGRRRRSSIPTACLYRQAQPLGALLVHPPLHLAISCRSATGVASGRLPPVPPDALVLRPGWRAASLLPGGCASQSAASSAKVPGAVPVVGFTPLVAARSAGLGQRGLLPHAGGCQTSPRSGRPSTVTRACHRRPCWMPPRGSRALLSPGPGRLRGPTH